MKKEKIHLEYLLNAASKNILWSAISTPTGLEDWFADKVVSDDKTVTFCWQNRTASGWYCCDSGIFVHSFPLA